MYLNYTSEYDTSSEIDSTTSTSGITTPARTVTSLQDELPLAPPNSPVSEFGETAASRRSPTNEAKATAMELDSPAKTAAVPLSVQMEVDSPEKASWFPNTSQPMELDSPQKASSPQSKSLPMEWSPPSPVRAVQSPSLPRMEVDPAEQPAMESLDQILQGASLPEKQTRMDGLSQILQGALHDPPSHSKGNSQPSGRRFRQSQNASIKRGATRSESLVAAITAAIEWHAPTQEVGAQGVSEGGSFEGGKRKDVDVAAKPAEGEESGDGDDGRGHRKGRR